MAGLAVFEARSRRKTLPDGAGAAYLRGIVVNLATEAESMAIADALLVERIKARDRAIDILHAQLDRLRQEQDPALLVKVFAAHATCAQRHLDHFYWLRALVDVVNDQPAEHRRSLLRLAARHISGAHRLPARDRDAAIRFVFAKAISIA